MGADQKLPAHLPALDGVRGMAVLLVMLFHFRSPDLPKWFSAALGLGWCGVDLFFVLSGFLITGILLETREKPGCLQVFWARRILRIFPLYFAALSLLLAFGAAGWSPAVADQKWYWLYLNNWLPLLESQNPDHLLGHFWSLAVEEQFYLIWPLAVWLLPAGWTLRVAIGGAALAALARAAAVAGGLAPELIYRGTLFRLDSLLAGAACAVLVRSAPWRSINAMSKRGLWITLPAMAAVLAAARSTHYQNAWIQLLGYPALWFGFSCLVLQCVAAPGRWRWLEAGWLQKCGRISYGLYVWHWPAAYALLKAGGPWGLHDPIAMQAAGFTLSFAAASVSYRIIEKPALSLKRHFSLERLPARTQAGGFFSSSISAGTTSNRSPTIP